MRNVCSHAPEVVIILLMVQGMIPNGRLSEASEVAEPTILNNFVTELLNVSSPTREEYTFVHSREGFVFVQIQTVAGKDMAMPTVHIDSQKLMVRQVGRNWEAMCPLPEGVHRIRASSMGIGRLVVRSVGDLVYCMYGADPMVSETGNYTWDFLRRHVLGSYNVIIGAEKPGKHEHEIREWTSEGKFWMTQRSLPWDAKTTNEVYEHFANQLGATHPLMHGIWGDEFLSMGEEKDGRIYPLFTAAIRKLRANPRFQGRRFYAYTASQFSPAMQPFVEAVVQSDYRLAREWYCVERPDEKDLAGYFGAAWELENRRQWEKAAREYGSHRLMILGLLSQPEESCDVFPHVDFNVFLDRQMQFLSTAPAFVGIRGLQGYYSRYAGEEQVRLFARLIRHYAMEGHTDRFLRDPYLLTHLRNPDFVRGLRDWTCEPAVPAVESEPASIAAKTVEGFGWLQGRYHESRTVGNTVLWTRRSSEKPNRVSQEIHDLLPGRLYSLRFFTGNYRDLVEDRSRDYQHEISIRIDGAELVPQKCFDARIKSNNAHRFEAFDASNPYRLNYHQRVFKALAPTGRLELSDWVSAEGPGGPEGEELIWNFIQIQPYWPEEPPAVANP